MSLAHAVSIHPYFKVHEGQLDAFLESLPKFIEKTQTEERCLFYNFTVNGDVVHCRESYQGAEGVLAHLDNVGELLAHALTISDLLRLEFHGPAEELDKLKEPLSHLEAEYFAYHDGVAK